MRTTHLKSHILPLLLLSFHSVSVCLADSCDFDGYMTRPGQSLTIATATKQQTGHDWEPIRIVASTKDLQGTPKYCRKKNTTANELSTQVNDPDCISRFGSIPAWKTASAISIIDKAIKLHTDRLLVKRVVGPLKIPDFSQHEFCMFFNVPEEHRTDGVTNADMVLYVAYARKFDERFSSLSMGLTCAKSDGGRPIAGGLSFGSDDIDISRHSVRLAAHHIAHALGFNYSEMKLRNMIVDKMVRNKPNSVAVVKSDKTKEMTRAHYGCPKAEGMELEDGGDRIKSPSHWERRNAKDELMANPTGDTGIFFMGFYTALTMAAFEDMGFYKANFEMAEHMEYGYNAGCDFLTDKCMDNGATKWPKMFCNASEKKRFPDMCTTDRMGFGNCQIKNDYSASLLSHFQYFTSDKEGGVALSLTDNCPVVEQERYFGCTNTDQQGNVPGGLYGKNSMCLEGSDLKVKNSDGNFVPYGAVCAEISCDGGSVRVKYLGDKHNKWHECPEGKSLNPSLTSTDFQSGTIKCPKYREVCIVAPDGSSLVKRATHEPNESSNKSPTASQDPTESQKPTGQTNNSNSGGKSKDGSSVPFGLIPCVIFLMLCFEGYLIA